MSRNELAPYLVTGYLRENVKAEFRETPEKFLADQSLRSDQETKDVRVVQKWLRG
jgi:hypothetical protein